MAITATATGIALGVTSLPLSVVNNSVVPVPDFNILLELPTWNPADGSQELGLWTSVRASTSVVTDYLGNPVTIPVEVIPYDGMRMQYDPANLFAEFTASATTPSPLTGITATFEDASTSAYMLDGVLSGQIPSGVSYNPDINAGQVLSVFLGSPSLTNFYCHTNQLTGSIPDLSTNTALREFRCHTNQLNGSIPDLSANTVLGYFNCHTNQLNGSIPDLSANTVLGYFYCESNQLTGSIPDLSANTDLINFRCNLNQLAGYISSTIPSSLTSLLLDNNNLVESAVNQILIDCDTATKGTGFTLTLEGGTNAAPVGAGITAKNNLIGRGATVTTN